jgi:GT2 family glycosyltransferase
MPAGAPARTGTLTDVSVFFPCYNDAATIGGLVTRAARTIDALGIDGDIVVVNDGSSDDSAEVLTAIAASEPRLRVVTHERNGGYGAALRSGFAAADRDWVFYTDGDGQYDPGELAQLVAHASDDVDVIQGYKLERSDNLARRVIGRMYHRFVSFLFGLRIRDTDCDFRLIRSSVLEDVELTKTSGVICVELVRKLQDADARIVEVGVHHYPRVSGTSTFFKPWNVVRTLRDLMVLWVALTLRRSPAPNETSPSPARVEWRAVLAPFFVSRALSDAFLVAIAMLRNPTNPLSGFTSWDGRWYQAIAVHGYVVPPHTHHHQTPWPFFPLFPEVLHAVSSLGIPLAYAGLVCNHVAFLLALIGIHRVASRYGTPSTVRLAVWLAALGPMSFVFSMLYPSAIFLAASVWAFVLVDERRDLAAGCAAAIAALSRPNGIVVVLALLIGVGFVFRRVVAVALPVVVALAGWVWFNALRTGDPLRFYDAKGAWHEVTIFNFMSQVNADAVLHLAIATLAIVLVVLVRRRIPASWLWYTILGLAPSLVFGVVGLARYATDSFPPTIAAAMLLDRGAASTRRNVLIGLVIVQIILAFYFIGIPQVI